MRPRTDRDGTRRPSCRPYDPQPARWEYPAGARVLKVDAQEKIEVQGQKWKISKALCGEWVRLVRLDDPVLVYYCARLFREIDLRRQCSTIVEHWRTTPGRVPV